MVSAMHITAGIYVNDAESFRPSLCPTRTAAEYNTDAEDKTKVVPVAVILHLV
ncbi:hypothetical protein ACFLWZ_08790 [Chloroflexota bacterium]